MAEDTTTEAHENTGGVVANVQVDENDQPVPEVAEETAEQSPETGGDEPLPDKDLASFAKGQGIDNVEELSERELKLLKVARDNQAEFTRKRQKDSELERTLSNTSDDVAEEVAESTGQDPELLKRMQRLEVRTAVQDFWDTNPDAREYEKDMIAKLGEKPHLAGDLDALYAVVLREKASETTSKAKREALENLAQKQQAAAPRGNAVNATGGSQKITPGNVDRLVAEHDQKWFEANYKEINEAMAA